MMKGGFKLRRPGRGVSRSVPLERGFTLIEIMIVVGIAALVMSMAVPFIYTSLRKDPMRQAVSDVIEACSRARARAILTGAPAELRISPQSGLLQVVSATPSAGNNAEMTGGYQTQGAAPSKPGAGTDFSAALSPDVVIELLDVSLIDS